MKTQKLFMIDNDLTELLQRETNQSLLVNGLIRDYFNKIEEVTPEKLLKLEEEMREIKAKVRDFRAKLAQKRRKDGENDRKRALLEQESPGFQRKKLIVAHWREYETYKLKGGKIGSFDLWIESGRPTA